MTSILSELKGNQADSIAILSRLFSKGTGASFGTKLQNDIVKTVERLVTSLNNKGNGRGTTCRLLAMITTSLHKSPEVESRLYTVVDRLSTLLESFSRITEFPDESEGFLVLLDALVTCGSEEILSRLNKILPKLTACACRLCDKEVTLVFGLSALSIFAESRSRMLMCPSSASIRKACLQAIDHPTNYTLASHVLALQNSTETTENWMINWCNLSAETVRIVLLLGVKVSIDKSTMSKVLPMIPSNSKILKLHGSRKALAIERAFRGCCASLCEMLHDGCSSGPVSVELTYLLPLFSSILTLSVDIQDNDAKSSVENECGVSPSDIRAVVTQIKISCVGVLTALFETQTQSVLTVCSALCRPLASMLAGKDMQNSQELSTSCLKCLSAAIKCFPTSIVRDTKSGVLVLIDLFRSEIENICAVRSSVLTADETGDTATHQGVLSCIIFETLEVLLLFSGPMLTTTMREEVEISVGKALSTMCRGILTPQRADRRMHRFVCEKLRENPVLQGLLLRVAYAEAFSSQRDGMLSGNISLLKRVCEIMSKQNNLNSNSIEAMRILLAVEIMLSPSSIALPSIPAVVAAKTFLTDKYATSTSTSTGIDLTSLTGSSAASASGSGSGSNVRNDDRELNLESTSFHSLKRSRDEENEVADEEESEDVDANNKKRSKTNEPSAFVANESLSVAFGNPKNKEITKNNSADDEDGDGDDDSLPDIDISADPEQ